MIRFIYSKTKIINSNKEKVLLKLFDKASQYLKLPKTLEVEFIDLHDSLYAETIVNPRYKNRIRLNNKLSEKEIIRPALHELIHLEQMYTGRLSSPRTGMYLWEGQLYNHNDLEKLSYVDYSNLPWETDVNERLDKLLISILK